MRSLKKKRNRGIVLTPKGLSQLQRARSNWENKENFGERCTYENISELTNLDINTIKKILAAREKVDKRSLEKFYIAFKLNLNEECYTKFNPKIREDWGEAVSIDHFFGRIVEIETLTHWLLSDRCRLISIQGMGGIGKTTLSIKFVNQIKGQFDCLIWKSLRYPSPATDLIGQLIEFLSAGKETEASLPKRIGDRITKLIGWLKSQRCLILIDNVESILDNNSRAGKYLQGYEEYGELFTRVGATNHDSCLILTTREKPKEIAALEGEKLAVRSLRLRGLKDGCEEIFKLKGLRATRSEFKTLSDRFSGNPLALKVVSTTIQDLFEGNIREFLQEEQSIFGDIHDILNQQFERLTSLERTIMYWLAIAREPISVKELQSDLVSSLSRIKILEALESLSRRSLIEKNAGCFTQQPVVMEYVTTRFIEIGYQEIVDGKFDIIQNHALIKATTKDYVKENQNRLILQPILNELLTVFNSKQNIEAHLNQILATLKELSSIPKGYTAGNILNLLHQMETDLTGLDLSNLCVWQADLRQAQLHNVNFQNADLSKSVFAENFGGIWSVAFSPDGKYLAAGDTKGDIILRRVADGQPIMRLKGHSGWVVSLDFSPDGKTVASSSCDCMAKLWDVNTGQCIHSLEEHENEVWSVKFSPDGKTVATGCDDHKARLWDIQTGKCLKIFRHISEVLTVIFSLDGKKLFSGSHDNTIKIWDIQTSHCEKVFQGHEDGVRSISLSSDGQILASSSNDRSIRLWKTNTGECLKVLQGHSNMVMSVTFSPQDKFIASSSIGQKVRLWDVKTGKCLKVFQGHSNTVNSVNFHPKDNILASGSYDQTVKLWNVNTYKCIQTWQGYSNQTLSIKFSSDGKTLFSGGQDQKVRVWDIKTGKVLKILHTHTNLVFSVAIDPVHNILASSSGDKTIKLCDINTGKEIAVLQGHEAAIRSVAFSADGKTLISGSDDRTVKVWDVNTGRILNNLRGHKAEIWSIAISKNNCILASASSDKTVKLWNTHTGKCLNTFRGHESWVWSIAFSPDDTKLASIGADQTIRFWNLKTGKCSKIWQDNIGNSQLIAFSPDGNIIVSCDQAHIIKFWQVSTGRCLKTLKGHRALINSISFSEDGTNLVSSSADETIKLWNIETNENFKTLTLEKPYHLMNITGTNGISIANINILKMLGAISN